MENLTKKLSDTEKDLKQQLEQELSNKQQMDQKTKTSR